MERLPEGPALQGALFMRRLGYGPLSPEDAAGYIGALKSMKNLELATGQLLGMYAFAADLLHMLSRELGVDVYDLLGELTGE